MSKFVDFYHKAVNQKTLRDEVMVTHVIIPTVIRREMEKEVSVQQAIRELKVKDSRIAMSRLDSILQQLSAEIQE